MICPKCGSTIDESAQFCPFCGEKVVQPAPEPEVLAPAAAEELTAEKETVTLPEPEPEQPYAPVQTEEQPYAPAQPEQQPYAPVQPEQQPYAPVQTEEQPYVPAQTEQQPYAPAQPEQQPYAPAQPEQQPYAPAQPEHPYVPNMQVQPFPAEPQTPQQYGAPQQPQYVQPAAPQTYGQTTYAQPQQQFVQPTPPQQQMYVQGGQMPYAQQPQYGGYPAQQPVYPGAVNPGMETPNIPAAIIILLADIALAVSFFLNMLFGATGFGGKAEFSLFRLYEYFGQAIEAVKTIFELLGKSGVELDKIDFGQIFPGEMWVALGIAFAVYILFLISFINVIVAIVRAFTARGPRVAYFWGSAGNVAGTTFTAYLIAFGGCILLNLRASGILDGVPGAKYREVMGVNWLFYVMLGISFAAIILAGVMKSMVKKKYMNPGLYRTGTPPRTNMY